MSVISVSESERIAPSQAQWAVVRTKPHQERLVVKNLLDRKVEPYCPLYQQPVWHLRAPRRPVPLFPGYVFARWHGDVVPNKVRFCPGVRYPVRFGECLAMVDDQLIEDIRQREGQRGFVLPVALETGFDQGCTVRIMAGPLEGVEGMFAGYVNSMERAKVLISILRRKSRVEVPVGRLVLVG